MKRILEDIRILDFSHVWFGPYCTMMLGELGAEIIKVEPPWGEIGRLGPGPLYKNVASNFYALNLNKKDIAIDLKAPEGLEIAKKLVKCCDVVVQNMVPGAMENLGLGYDVLKRLNPKIIYAALSGFGQYGPYKDYASYAVIAEAMSGHTFATGKNFNPDGPPINMAGALGDLGPAVFAAFSIVAAIRYRDKTGKGQMIDVSQLDCMASFNTCAITEYSLFGETTVEIRKRQPRDPNRIWGIMKVKDGWIQVAGERPKAIEKLKEKLGVQELNKQDVERMVAEMTRREAFDFLVEVGMPVAPIYEAYESISDPHLKTRGMFIQVNHPIAGTYTTPNFPVKLSETPGIVETPAPLLGQHTENVLKSLLGYPKEKIEELEKIGVIVCHRD
ncbi:MAG: CaiB/BaiF CoA transferase family protein [Candidatus Bathyarchaeia archaeon]